MKLNPETLKALRSNRLTDAQVDEALSFFKELMESLASLGPDWALAYEGASREYWGLQNLKVIRSW